MIIHRDKIAFIGMGKFGTAIAYRLDLTQKHEISFYTRNSEIAEKFNQEKLNPRCFSEFEFSKHTSATDNILDSIKNAPNIFITSESSEILNIAEKIKGKLKKGANIILCSKGISEFYPFFYSEMVKEILGNSVNIYVFSGPNFADEIIKGELSITTLAGKSSIKNHFTALLFRNTNIKIETTTDIIGVQIFGAMKNVMAITVGILEGVGLGKNRIIRTLMNFVSEIQRLGKFYKSDKNTAYLSAGIGDIMLTCFDNKSRNKSFGIKIGQGEKVADLLKNDLVEGYYAVNALREMSKKVRRMNNKSLKYINALYDILYKNKDPIGALNKVEKISGYTSSGNKEILKKISIFIITKIISIFKLVLKKIK